jgi:hypothetical protein
MREHSPSRLRSNAPILGHSRKLRFDQVTQQRVQCSQSPIVAPDNLTEQDRDSHADGKPLAALPQQRFIC